MKKWSLFLGIGAAVLGLFVIIFPTFWIRLIFIALGLLAVGYGIYTLKEKRDFLEDDRYKRFNLIQSITSIVVGIISVICPLAAGNAAWTFVIILLIIYFVGYSALGFYTCYLIKQANLDDYPAITKRLRIENLASLFAAILLIIISPKKLGTAIIRIIGIVVMLAGIGLIVYSILSKKNEAVYEAEIKDEPKDEGDSQ